MPQLIRYLIITYGTQPLPNYLGIHLTQLRYGGCGQMQQRVQESEVKSFRTSKMISGADVSRKSSQVMNIRRTNRCRRRISNNTPTRTPAPISTLGHRQMGFCESLARGANFQETPPPPSLDPAPVPSPGHLLLGCEAALLVGPHESPSGCRRLGVSRQVLAEPKPTAALAT